jgi:hypothetical protein
LGMMGEEEEDAETKKLKAVFAGHFPLQLRIKSGIFTEHTTHTHQHQHTPHTHTPNNLLYNLVFREIREMMQR